MTDRSESANDTYVQRCLIFLKEVYNQNLLGAYGFVLHKELYICTISYNLKILYVYYYYDAIETISCVK